MVKGTQRNVQAIYYKNMFGNRFTQDRLMTNRLFPFTYIHQTENLHVVIIGNKRELRGLIFQIKDKLKIYYIKYE